MRGRLFKIAGATILAIAIIWALVLGWWQSNDYKPAMAELVLYLGILPFSLVGGFWLLYGFIEHIKNPPAPPQPKDAATADVDPLASAAARTAAAERNFTINLIGAFATSGAGSSISEILDAVASGKRPKPDPELKDEDGFPVFCSKNNDLDSADFLDRLTAFDERFPAALREGECLRALAMLDTTLPGAIDHAAELIQQTLPAARLRLLWLMPADWDPEHSQALLAWLRSEYLAALDPSRIELSARTVATEADALGEIDELILASQREQLENDLHLVIAANSAIGEKTLHTWSANNALFNASNQSGQMPGEAATCLLFTGKQADTQTVLEGLVRISRISRAVRDKPVDAGGRITAALLQQLIDGILTIRGVDASAIKTIVSDNDHRESRVNELLLAVGEKFKELEPMAACLQIGSACGSTAPVGSLLALACAREKALSGEGPVICISNQHPTDRAVLLVETPTPPADPEIISA